MQMIIKVKGITRRWIFNVLTITFALIVLLAVIICLLIRSTAYNRVRGDISARMNTVTLWLSGYTASTFEGGARTFIEGFDDKGKLEIQIINSEGQIFVTTQGFDPPREEMPDYLSAKSKKISAEWIGKNENGERVIAVTCFLNMPDMPNPPAVRFVVSLTYVNQQMMFNYLIIFAVGLGVLLFTLISGLYFINSIVRPIQEVNAVARKIAMGNFDSKLPVRENSEIGELCDTINFMAGELKSTERMKNEFISSVSHELRTPMTAIKGWGETVREALNTDPEIVQKGLSVILSESERLSGLVEDLLDFSRMQSGRLSFNMKRIDVLADLTEAVYMFRDVAAKSGIELSYIEPASVSPILGDANRLKQVFINIIDNAIKYTSPGGKVLIEALETDGFIKIRVLDTGRGIPLAELPMVKEKFYKANNSVRGSGIGLAVADEIIRLHKGELDIDSVEGEGTSVTIMLPALPRSEEDTVDAAINELTVNN
ncbi:MAG: HAMP domain-containing histidine kinase [Oscillospiraceae bacterium]|jgi:signal transduction histidine kinase|nr:HAMP domain-containing histidine kinase [Oscillospiraceae bacterium]